MSVIKKIISFFTNEAGWFTQLLNFVHSQVVSPALVQFGGDGIVFLERTIKFASQQDWSNEEKFRFVWNEIRRVYPPEKIKDSVVKLAIEIVVSTLKKKRVI